MTKYERWVDELSKTLINNLENKLIFEKKVQVLEITVKVQKDSTIARVITEGGDRFKLILEINEEDDERFIQFVICHELWHLLFSVIGKLIISQYSASDDSLAITNVQRESEGKRYGEFFEEMLCDYLGLRLLWLYYAGKYTMAELKKIVYSVRKSDPVYNAQKYDFTKSIISNFGEVDVFDTYSKDTSYPDNILLYTVITGNLNLLINDYDECMGKGAWKRFMNHFENYILFDDESSKEFIAIEMKRFKMIDELK